MGGNESRVEHYDSPTDDSDDWKSRVEVKPSKQLVARLEQLQRNQDSTGIIETNTGTCAEPSALEEDQRQQENERGLAMQRDAEVHARGVRREEVSVSTLTAYTCSEYLRRAQQFNTTAKLKGTSAYVHSIVPGVVSAPHSATCHHASS